MIEEAAATQMLCSEVPRLSCLFQEKADHLFVQLSIWLIAHRQIEPCLFVYDTLVVSESIKADLPVVGSHAALAETAESHFCGGEMDDGIVDASSAKSAAGDDFFSLFFCQK